MTTGDRANLNWRMATALWLLGLAASLSLLFVPLEVLQPAGLGLGKWQFRLLSLINPLILLTASVAIGCLLAARVGLDAPVIRALIDRRHPWQPLRRQLLPALLVGAAVAVLLISYARLSADWFAAATPAGFIMPLHAKLLYGGVVEELLTRWGLMTLFTWAAWRVTGARQPVGRGAYIIGAMLAALLFAAGHLPLLFMLVPNPPAAVLAAVLAGNAVPGLLFAWLFRRFGLESAMLAHALAHLFSTVIG